MNLTQPQIDKILHILTKQVKHRKTSPFQNELSRYLRDVPAGEVRKPYHFLNEDYYQFLLVEEQKLNRPFRLIVSSMKPEIVKAADEANLELNRIFS
jgi:hypothetical protein